MFNKRVQLAKDSTSPVVEYANQFTLPADCLRVLKIHTGVTDSVKTDMEYKIEGRKVKTNEGTIFLIYIAIDTDPNNYDTYLQESIAHQLAADICYAITNNATLANNYMARADERLREASIHRRNRNATFRHNREQRIY